MSRRRHVLSAVLVALAVGLVIPGVASAAPQVDREIDCAAQPDHPWCQLVTLVVDRAPTGQTVGERVDTSLAGVIDEQAAVHVRLCVAAGPALATARDDRLAGLRDCLAGVRQELQRAELIPSGRGALDMAFGLTATTTPDGPGAGGISSCGSTADPRIAGPDGGYNYANWPHREVPPDERGHAKKHAGNERYQKLVREAELAWRDYLKTLAYVADQDTLEDTPENQALRRTLERAEKDANEAIDERNQFPKASTDGNDGVIPEDGTALARTAAGSDSACAATSQFLLDCDAAGWKTGPCSVFLDQLSGCDTTVMLIDPDGTTWCGQLADVPAATVEATVQELCWTRINPVDPDTNPCGAPAVEQSVLLGVVDRDPVCGNPYALTTAEGCQPEPPNLEQITQSLLQTDAKRDAVVATLSGMCGCHLPGFGDFKEPPDNPRSSVGVWAADAASGGPDVLGTA